MLRNARFRSVVLATIVSAGFGLASCSGTVDEDQAGPEANTPSSPEKVEASASETEPSAEELQPRPKPLMPEHRIVAFYGVPRVSGMGTLGKGEPEEVVERLVAEAEIWAEIDRPVIPALEVIATVAQAGPGDDGTYSAPIEREHIGEYLEAIRAVDGIMILDFQTGREEYMDQLPRYEEFLREPDVHVALDPEWEMGPNDVPNRIVGSSDAESINAVMEYLDEIIVEDNLPPKIVVLHQFQKRMISNRDKVDPPSTIDVVWHLDGHGPPPTKIENYEFLASSTGLNGFKLFLQRDIPYMDPEEVLELSPEPEFISIQ